MSGEAIDEVCERIRGLKRPIRCLSVEDSSSDEELLERVLRPYNVHIDRATDAESAVRCITQNRFDVVLLDLTLKCPGNGIGVLRHIMSLTEHPSVVVLTGASVTGEIFRQVMEIGGGHIAIVHKPMSAEQAHMFFGKL